MTRTRLSLAFALAAFASFPHAQEPQSLSAKIGDSAFESGDDEITLVPISGSFTLSAATRGAAAWPPPKTPIDRLAITCDGFKDGKPLLLDSKAFARSTCDVTFEKGTKPMGGEPEASWTLDKRAADNRFEIARADGKVYKGTFSFRLKDARGGTVAITNGRFRIEDRQL